MKDTVIITDSCANLPNEYIKKNNIKVIPMYYRFGNKIYDDSIVKNVTDFYKKLKTGEEVHTLCTNLDDIKNIFEYELKNGNNIIYISFSSKLSSSYQNSIIVKNELEEKNKNNKIYCIDSLTGSLAQGFTVIKTLNFLNNNSLNDTLDSINEISISSKMEFIVDDLNYLRKGGRLNSTSAVVGGLLNIKPIVHTDEYGKVTLLGKYAGKKLALHKLVNRLIDNADFNELIGIVHADDIKTANNIKDEIYKLKQIKDIIITELTPSIGAHLGPNSIGIAYTKKLT